MKKTSVKLILSFMAFLAVNLWLVCWAAAKGGALFFISISPVLEETILFFLLQLSVIVVYFIRPLTLKKSKIIYWCVSEAFVLATVFFWGIFVVGPIWLI
ncbi:MAG: hypothetical protein ACI4SF_11510 [Oscillospiraceae bacterium]